MRFNLLSGADIRNQSPMRWTVRGVLPELGLAALYGASGSGKSFLALDLAAAIAGDADAWFSLRVQHRSVTYVILEGEAGLVKRISAWESYYGKTLPTALRFVFGPFDLRKPDDVAKLAAAILALQGRGGLIILDTLNRAAPGADENSSADMGKIIAAAKRLQLMIGGLVLLLHHTGKDATKGLRGHSSLHAALDAAIEVIPTQANDKNKVRKWRVAKSKDDEDGKAYPFTLQQVKVGTDEYGDITSCVVLPGASCGPEQKHEQRLGANQKKAKNIIDGLLRESWGWYTDFATQKGYNAVLYEEALTHVSPQMSGDAKHQRERAKDAVKSLVNNGLYRSDGEWLWRP